MRSVLITGGAGFVGSSLALRFRSACPAGRVVALDNLYRKGSELNAARLRSAGVEVVVGDVRRPADLDIGPFDVVVDAAAEPSVMAGGSGGDDVRYLLDTNLVGTLHALEAARRWRAAFVFLSTSRVYPLEALRAIRLEERGDRFEIAAEQALPGVSPDGIAEGFPLAGARTLYGATKYASEVMVAEYAAQFGLRAVIDRCGVLAGPWQMGRADQGVIALWVARHHYGLPLAYIGYGGRQVRDVLHVEDLADLVLAQLDTGVPLRGQVYNVGGGRAVSCSLRELTALARQATGRTLEVAEDSAVRTGDVPLYVTDAARVKADFGWKPCRSLDRVVADIARWIAGHAEALRPILT